MPGKHHESSFASRHRYPLVIAVVLLCIAVAGVFAAVSNRRDPDPPLLITPALTALPSASVWPTPVAASASASAAPSHRPTSARPARSSPPAARRTPSPAAADFTARYVIVGGRQSSFQAGIVITNNGRTARTWRLTVTHDPGVRLQGSVGATATASGSTITFSGGPLGPGDSVTAGYQASKDSGDEARPTSCRIEGTACSVSVRRYRNESGERRR